MELIKKKENIKRNQNQDTIGTKPVLNLPKLEPILISDKTWKGSEKSSLVKK